MRLVLDDAELGIDIVLHTVVITIQVIWGYVHQYGDIGTELIHIIQLERTQFDDVVIMLVLGNLQSEAFADISCQSYVQSGTFKNVVDEAGGSRFSIRSGDTDHFGIGISSGKLDLRDDGRTLCLQFQNQWSIVRDAGAFHYFIGIQYQFFGVMTFFPGNTVAVEQFLVSVFDGRHIRYERLETLCLG